MPSLTWTQPVCDHCWYKQYPGQEPHRLQPGQQEYCCKCNTPTIGGVYIRIDPTTVPHPKEGPQ